MRGDWIIGEIIGEIIGGNYRGKLLINALCTPLTEDIIDDYEQLLMDKKLKIEIQGEDVLIVGDRKRIEMVIQNYLSNNTTYNLSLQQKYPAIWNILFFGVRTLKSLSKLRNK